MRTVLYDAEDGEPITVIDLKPWHMKIAREHHGHLRLPIYRTASVVDLELPPILQENSVDLELVETQWRDRKNFTCAFVRRSDLALLLPSVFLPGQQKQLNDERRHAAAEAIGQLLAAFH